MWFWGDKFVRPSINHKTYPIASTIPQSEREVRVVFLVRSDSTILMSVAPISPPSNWAKYMFGTKWVPFNANDTRVLFAVRPAEIDSLTSLKTIPTTWKPFTTTLPRIKWSYLTNPISSALNSKKGVKKLKNPSFRYYCLQENENVKLDSIEKGTKKIIPARLSSLRVTFLLSSSAPNRRAA